MPSTASVLPALRWAFGLAALATIVTYGGIPSHNVLPFVLGVATLTATVVGVVALARWILSARAEQRLDVSADLLRGLAFTVLLGAAAIVVGAFWDEIWHRRFGLPFGEDFFWRPHLLMYAGLLTVMVSAAYAGIVLWKRGSALGPGGSWRSRAAAAPTLAVLVILGLFLGYVLPADPLWHTLYGADLTAWSLPHLVLGGSFVAIALVALALHRASFRRGAEDALARYAVPVMALALSLSQLLQLFMTEYDGLPAEPVSSLMTIYQRPDWMFAAALAAAPVFVGALAVTLLRFPGAATLVGVAALAIRFSLLAALVPEGLTANAFLLALPALIAIDAAYLLRARGWRGLGAGAAAGLAAGSLPWATNLVAFPAFAWSDVPAMLVAIVVVSFGAAWAGERVGSALATGSRERIAPSRHARPAWQWATGGAVYLAAVAWFMLTASPPV